MRLEVPIDHSIKGTQLVSLPAERWERATHLEVECLQLCDCVLSEAPSAEAEALAALADP